MWAYVTKCVTRIAWLHSENTMTEPAVSKTRTLSAGETLLNNEISALANIAQGHDRREFESLYKGLFVNVLGAVSTLVGSRGPDSEAITADILKTARVAAAFRRGRLLPAGRPNANYRHYERVYTYALVSAVATEGTIDVHSNKQQEIDARVPGGDKMQLQALAGRPLSWWAEAIVPKPGLLWLKEDDGVWNDWIEYFDPEADSLMAVIAHEAKMQTGHPAKIALLAQPTKTPTAEAAADAKSPSLRVPIKPPKTPLSDKSGTVILEALKSGVVSGELPCNGPDGLVQVDADGRTFLRTPDIYQWYIEKTGEDITWQEVRNRLIRLGIFAREQGKDRFWGKTSANAKKIAGVVLRDSSNLWIEPIPAGTFVIFPRTDKPGHATP